MKTPFTTEQFFDVFKSYNLVVFPLQGVFYIVALFAIYLAIFPTKRSDKIVSGILAFFWMWMGIAYHLLFFTSINKAAYLFGALFILEGVAFLKYGVFGRMLTFRFRSSRHWKWGTILIVYALIVYPLFGYFLGHKFPYAATFGLPCPTTIFTFGMLLSTKKCPFPILIIPLAWSLIGFTAAYSFGVTEDVGLVIAALFALFFLAPRISSFSGKKVSNPLTKS